MLHDKYDFMKMQGMKVNVFILFLVGDMGCGFLETHWQLEGLYINKILQSFQVSL